MGEAAPVLNQFNLVVRDMDATVTFYRRLGLTIPETNASVAQHHRTAIMPSGIALDFDSQEFARQWNAGWPVQNDGGGMGVLGFGLASRETVDALYAHITDAGFRGQQEPYDAFWGARYAVVEDPDGNAVGLMSPVDPERRMRSAAP